MMGQHGKGWDPREKPGTQFITYREILRFSIITMLSNYSPKHSLMLNFDRAHREQPDSKKGGMRSGFICKRHRK